VVPRALETDEVPGIVEEFRRGAENALLSGFDGVEIHGANGYLLDQFLQDGSNKRTDQYGGPVENRARLMLEVTDAVVSVWGADRVGMHLNLRSDSHSVSDSDPIATFGYVARELDARKIAFVVGRESLEEPRIAPVVRSSYRGVFVANDRLTRESAEDLVASGEADAVAFGKLFIANPDLPARFAANAPLNAWNSATFYAKGAEGYTDYPSMRVEEAA